MRKVVNSLKFYEIYVDVDTLVDGAQLLGGGEAFMDPTVWEENIIIHYEEDEVNTETFVLSGTRLNAEEIMSRINTDCNDNNQWDDAEEIDEDILFCASDLDCGDSYKCSIGGESNPLNDADGFCYFISPSPEQLVFVDSHGAIPEHSLCTQDLTLVCLERLWANVESH